MTPTQTAIMDRAAKAMGYAFFIGERKSGPEGPCDREYGKPSTCDRLNLRWSIDSAAACLKPGWEWSFDGGVWTAWKNDHEYVATPDTGDEIADRYTLNAMTWEAK